MTKYSYWQSYEFPDYLVRECDALFEEYQKGVGWVANRDRIDIISGIDPFYTRVTEVEAETIINRIEKTNFK